MNKICLIVVTLLLSACGFHLKGNGVVSQPLPYQSWQVEGDGAMRSAIEKALYRADGKTVDASKAQAKVTITRVETHRDVYTITQAAIINEYLMTLRVEAQVSRNGEPVGEPMVIMVRRVMDYADNEVLGKQEEGQTIWDEMQADAAEQIVRQLSFIKAS